MIYCQSVLGMAGWQVPSETPSLVQNKILNHLLCQPSSQAQVPTGIHGFMTAHTSERYCIQIQCNNWHHIPDVAAKSLDYLLYSPPMPSILHCLVAETSPSGSSPFGDSVCAFKIPTFLYPFVNIPGRETPQRTDPKIRWEH